MDQDKYEIVAAQLWASFGAGADLPIEPECHEVAERLQFIKNVRCNVDDFDEAIHLKNTKYCCHKAGLRAAMIAADKGHNTITGSTYEEAVLWVAKWRKEILERINKNEKLAERVLGMQTGGVC